MYQRHDGRPLRMLIILDEYTRKSLAIDVAKQLMADDVLARLTVRFIWRGVPECIRTDNGTVFTASLVRDWLMEVGVRTLYFESGSTWENEYIEYFNCKLRNELLNGEIFVTQLESQVLSKRWRKDYNRIRPHSKLEYRKPRPRY